MAHQRRLIASEPPRAATYYQKTPHDDHCGRVRVLRCHDRERRDARV